MSEQIERVAFSVATANGCREMTFERFIDAIEYIRASIGELDETATIMNEKIENEAKLLSKPILQAFLDNDGDELQRQVFLVCKELVERRNRRS